MKAFQDKYFDFIVLCVWLATSLFIAVDPILYYGSFVNDFRGYYAAAYVFRNGGNPYDYFLTSKALLEITGFMGNNPYYYVPWVAWAFVPFTFIPFRMAFLVWNTINLVLWIIGLHQIKVLLKLPWSGWRLFALYFASTLSFAWVTFRYGQIGFLLMILFLAALIALKKEQWVLGGWWLSLCLIKPNVMIVPVGIICLWFLLKRIWKPSLVVVSINTFLLILSLLVMPNWYQPLTAPHAFDGIYHNIEGPGVLINDRINPTMLGVMKVLNVNQRIAVSVYVILIVLGLVVLFLAFRKANSVLEVAIISSALWLLLTPYAQTYDYLILVVGFFFLAVAQIRPPIIKVFGLLTILLAPLFGTTPLNSYLMVICINCLLALYYLQTKRYLFADHEFLDSPTLK